MGSLLRRQFRDLRRLATRPLQTRFFRMRLLQERRGKCSNFLHRVCEHAGT